MARREATSTDEQTVSRRSVATVVGSLGLLALAACRKTNKDSEARPDPVGTTTESLDSPPAVIFMDQGTQNTIDGPLYDKTAGTLSVGGSLIAGAASTLDDPPSSAIGAAHSVQPSVGAFAAGAACTASSNWCIAMSYLAKATGAGAIAIGEECEATAPNSTAFGFVSRAAAPYSLAMGFEAQANGPLSVAVGTSICRKYGEFSHASNATAWNAEGWHAVDQYAQAISGSAVTLLLADATELDFPFRQLFSVRVRLMGISSDYSKYAHEVWELLLFVSPTGVASIAQIPAKIAGASSAGPNGFSDCGWSYADFQTPFTTSGQSYAGGIDSTTPIATLRTWCKPADGENVQFSARVEWTVLAY